MLFIGMPWLIFHYVTKWKQAPKITQEDERLLDEMHQLSRRLEERLHTVERIIAADNPDWRPGLGVPEEREAYRLENREELRRDRDDLRRETRDPYRIERSN
jgi:phage shock protein B